ncbi:MAG: VOC family protein [Fimbriimonadaceae bacterium]|nr:VOC family protein [Fimbriimonadaceae bacterium]
MITSVHLMIYSDDAPATRAFLRDVLGLTFVAMKEAEMGEEEWLIFRTGPSELGVHPTFSVWEGKEYRHPRHHSLSFMCDDLNATMADLASRGAKFVGEIEDHGYGLVVMLEVPGADPVQLYQPMHPVAYNLVH